MSMNIQRLINDAPKNFKEDIYEIVNLSGMFLRETEIDIDDSLEEIKIELDMAQSRLFEMFSKLLHLVREKSKTKAEDLTAFGLALKFEEDLGDVISHFLITNISTGYTPNLTFYSGIARDYRTAYEFMILQPILTANKIYTSDDNYLPTIFTMASTNATVLGCAGIKSPKREQKTSKGVIPDARSALLEQFQKARQSEKEPKGKTSVKLSKQIDELVRKSKEEDSEEEYEESDESGDDENV